jgi:hypothetical protein
VGVVGQGETCQVGCGVGSTSCTSAEGGKGSGPAQVDGKKEKVGLGK